jgi:archaeal flagellar protein FlaJ
MAKNEEPRTPRKGGGYGRYLEAVGVGMGPVPWIVLALLVAIAVGALVFFLSPDTLNIVIMAPLFIIVLMIGAPILMKEKRDTEIEDEIPNVFEELATSLRAGATIEQALVDLTEIQKGALIDELKLALRDMEGGLSFEEALQSLTDRVDVVLLRRIFAIIVDGRKAGGELADILDSVAEDARSTSRIQRERRSKTLMYALFLMGACGFIAPIIFGFVTVIGDVVTGIGNAGATNPLVFQGINILWLYLLIASVISGIMMAVVRGEKIWKGVLIYALVMAVSSTVIFELVKMVAMSSLGV